jgi:hypothetical protein
MDAEPPADDNPTRAVCANSGIVSEITYDHSLQHNEFEQLCTHYVSNKLDKELLIKSCLFSAFSIHRIDIGSPTPRCE